MFAEGPDGFTGGLSANNYRTITGAATATATRDLADLVRLGALRREGARKSTRYYLATGK
jgi:Fic family protein